MRKWQRIVDELVSEAIGDGDVSHLPGAGEKLPAAENSNTPSEWRLAFKIMREQGVLPEWITAGKALAAQEEKLRQRIKTRAARYQRELKATRSKPTVQAQCKKRWQTYQADYREQVERYNRELLLYNLKLPAGLPHRQPLSGEQLIEEALKLAENNLS